MLIFQKKLLTRDVYCAIVGECERGQAFFLCPEFGLLQVVRTTNTNFFGGRNNESKDYLRVHRLQAAQLQSDEG